MPSLQRTRSLRKPRIPPPAEQTTNSAINSRSASPSRLPIKPPRPTSVIAPSSTAPSNTVTSTGTARSSSSSSSSRPASTVLGRSKSLSKKQNAAPALDAPAPVRKESRYPPLSSTNRPVVKARPTSAGGGSTPSRAPTNTHVRVKSTVTNLTGATSLRPPSRERTGAGGTARQVRERSASSADKGASTPAKHVVAPTPAAAPTAKPGQPRLRPTFSTLQQHYSPAKTQAPKPLTSTILAPPSPSKLPANVAASAETSRLQAELLQLHLLHRDAQTVQVQWQASAKEKLGKRFEQLRRESQAVAAREQSAAEDDNILALRQWARSGSKGIEQKIQTLDEIVTGLWTLSEPAGRYARIVRRFERWVDHMCDAEEARQDMDRMIMMTGQDALFIGEPDGSWKEDCAGVARRLETWRGQLSTIDDLVTGKADGMGGEPSSLEKMLNGSRELICDMLTELHAMEEIEQQALAREDDWIDRMNKEGDEDIDTPRAGAVWRVM
ncbi:hypothetical protein QQS21_008168 [Conoideocrella luteorostrata]|uniref:AGA1 A-agglutinin anchor subunit n=1 Tax=Conoideocrella luteorostrata TaxID=1105319 RepID=A0AAJ0CJB3_9HYPO|nr:hypothetical protein QQS21_008168 [Conoideocrella luteorostrata]